MDRFLSHFQASGQTTTDAGNNVRKGQTASETREKQVSEDAKPVDPETAEDIRKTMIDLVIPKWMMSLITGLDNSSQHSTARTVGFVSQLRYSIFQTNGMTHQCSEVYWPHATNRPKEFEKRHWRYICRHGLQTRISSSRISPHRR